MAECSNIQSSTTFMCQICADEKPTKDLFERLACKHSNCTECVANYIASMLQDSATIITCPVSSCSEVLEPLQCFSILPRDVFDLWSGVLCENVISGWNKFYCPFENCSGFTVDERSGDGEIIIESECPHCNRLFCAECGVPWHSEITCGVFQKLKKVKRSSEGSGFVTKLAFVCEICVDEKPGTDLFGKLGCEHLYCSDCICKYIASRLQDNVVTISCPVSGCFGALEPHHCRSILPSNISDRWDAALCEAAISGSTKFYCPYKDCSAALVDDMRAVGEVINEAECPHCNRLFCGECKVPWHPEIECSEFRKLKNGERSNGDIMLMNLAKSKMWRRCGQCGFFVDKVSGCLSMTCRCGHTFCYSCGSPIKDHYCNKCKR